MNPQSGGEQPHGNGVGACNTRFETDEYIGRVQLARRPLQQLAQIAAAE